MGQEDRVAFYEKQQASWAAVRRICEAGADRVWDSERRQRLQCALHLVVDLEQEAAAMSNRIRSQGKNG